MQNINSMRPRNIYKRGCRLLAITLHSFTYVVRRQSLAFLLIPTLTLGDFGGVITTILNSRSEQSVLKPLSSHAANVLDESYRTAPQTSDELAQQLDAERVQVDEDVNKGKKVERTKVKELTALRNEKERVWLNDDGTYTMEQSVFPSSYKKNGMWKNIDTTLEKDNKGAWKSKANKWQAKFDELSVDDGIGITQNTINLTLNPVTDRRIKPNVIDRDGTQVVVYEDVWRGVDIEYTVVSYGVKESIVITKPNADIHPFQFKVEGTTLTSIEDRPGWFDLSGEFAGFKLPAPTVATSKEGVIGADPYVTQRYDGENLTIELDKDWLDKQDKNAFPLLIDPSFVIGTQNTYLGLKSDGFRCYPGQGCGNGVGVTSSGYDWETQVHFSTGALQDKDLIQARLFVEMGTSAHCPVYCGTYNQRSLWVYYPTCNNYDCASLTHGYGLGTAFTTGDVYVTNVFESLFDNNDYDAWLVMVGEREDAYYESYKFFREDKTRVEFIYNTPPPASTLTAPANNSIQTTTQPALSAARVTDPDGNAMQYLFNIATNPDAVNGGVANSGWLRTPKWTVPEYVLQDGTTYYWRVQTWDGVAQTDPVNSPGIRHFKVDLRTGKDGTQTYDAVGDTNINLATGNLVTGARSHPMTALGGELGVSFDYNSPLLSKPGLIAEYWNDPSQTGVIPSTAPDSTRTEAKIDYDWGYGSPHAGMITNDHFVARWKGFFVAPQTGSYEFGTTADDNVKIWADNTQVLNVGCCTSNHFGSAVSLTEGQIIPIKVEFTETVGLAYISLKVRGVVGSAQTVSPDWLQTGVKPVGASHGLVGKYYHTSGGVAPNFPETPLDQPFLIRTDPSLSFWWVSASPVSSGPMDDFMVRWTGYFTAPVAGNYKFGTDADDGKKIWVDGNLILDKWCDCPNINPAKHWSNNSVYFDTGESKLIRIDYYENNGTAKMFLLVDGPTIDKGQPVPSKYLSPGTQVLPDGWSVDAGSHGNLTYTFATIGSNSITLHDSDGEKHEYKYENGVYKAPKYEDGYLTRHSNGILNLQDSDGRTYVFNADGTLQKTSVPVEDKNPAALEYEYSGSPTHLTYIRDGVNNNRWAKLLYSGDSSCPAVPTGFGTVPSNMICAVETSDGQMTKLFYSTEGQLTRIEQPGGANTDFGYELIATSTSITISRIIQMRNVLANDAIAAGVKPQDDTSTTQITYNDLGKVESVTLPLGQAWSTRQKHTYEYLQDSTMVHNPDAAETYGFVKRVQFDDKLRTVAETDIANLTQSTLWHADRDLVLKTTEVDGRVTNYHYDRNDRLLNTYGPAPSSWFSSSRYPLQAYQNQIPRKESLYDENIDGLAVAYYNYSPSGKSLVGAPKLHTTGIQSGVVGGDIYRTWNSNRPITPDPNHDWGLRMTGEIYLSRVSNHTFRIFSDDGVRLYVGEKLIIDDWNDGGQRSHATGVFNAPNVGWYKIRLDYYDRSNGDARLEMLTTPPGGSETSQLSSILSPNYGLETTRRSYDSTIGTTSIMTDYGDNPELGLARSNTLDPSGLDHVSTATFEAPNSSGSFLRQTNKTLAGGNSTTYEHYGALDTMDNPCTTSVEAYPQAGAIKKTIEPDPDGGGSQTSRSLESIYDEAGRVVAHRINNEDWSCNHYDTRGRIIEEYTPARGSEVSRVISYNWAVDGNPLTTRIEDIEGAITQTTDLLGRLTVYVDTYGDWTGYWYDDLGRLINKSGSHGEELFAYDDFNRLIEHKLDGVVVAVPSYDQYGQLASVAYPAAGDLELSTIGRDDIGRLEEMTYTLGDGTSTVYDWSLRSQSGQITDQFINGVIHSYIYDKAGRLTSATVGSDSFIYSYGASTGCASGSNPDAGKNSNRISSSVTIDSVTTNTNNCYDYADRLVSSTDPDIGNPVYDDHGNITQLGTSSSNNLKLYYDVNDRTWGVEENDGETAMYYSRDATGRITGRYFDENYWTTETSTFYGYTGDGDSPTFTRNENWDIVEKYISLPGGVVLTVRPLEAQTSDKSVYSLVNIHGDVMATTDASGTQTGTFVYGPFGEALSGSADNMSGGTDATWLGQHQRTTETSLALKPVQMCARVYIPSIGRFTSVDPIDGGGLNSYIYPPDPINYNDTSGKYVETGLDLVSVAYSANEYNNNPTTWNKVFLTVDVVALALPIIPGTGVARGVITRFVGRPIVNKISKGQPLGVAMQNSRALGSSSRLFGNSSIRNATSNGMQGILNKKTSPVRLGWSVGPDPISSSGLNPIFRLVWKGVPFMSSTKKLKIDFVRGEFYY